MKFAIIQVQNKQYQVSEGTVIRVLGVNKNPEVSVLFYNDGKSPVVNEADLKDVKVVTEVLPTTETVKMKVKRFKSKSRYHKTKGSKETYTQVKVTRLYTGTDSDGVTSAEVKPVKVKSTKPSSKPAVKAKTTEKKPVKKLKKDDK